MFGNSFIDQPSSVVTLPSVYDNDSSVAPITKLQEYLLARERAATTLFVM